MDLVKIGPTAFASAALVFVVPQIYRHTSYELLRNAIDGIYVFC
jgi:hypothetical protein